MANFFSSKVFLDAAASSFFPSENYQIISACLKNRYFNLLKVKGRIKTSLQCQDFLESDDKPKFATEKISFLPFVSHGSVEINYWSESHFASFCEPSPFIKWGIFQTWEQYVQYARNNSKRTFRPYYFRSLKRDLGEIRFEFDSSDESLIELSMKWKSNQYLRSGKIDLFSAKRVRRFFFELRSQQILPVSTLFAGDTPVAIHMGVLYFDRWYYWYPAYNNDLKKYSPGTILLEEMLKYSFLNKHNEFDFLIGAEPYKLPYTTHARAIGALGMPPIMKRIWKPVRQQILNPIKHLKPFYSFLQAAKRHYRHSKLDK